MNMNDCRTVLSTFDSKHYAWMLEIQPVINSGKKQVEIFSVTSLVFWKRCSENEAKPSTKSSFNF